MMKLTHILFYAWRISPSVRLRILSDAAVGVVRIGCGLLFIWLSKQLIDIAVGKHIHCASARISAASSVQPGINT